MRTIVVGVIVVIALAGFWLWAQQPPIDLTTPYHAVVLTGGQVFIGKLEKAGSRYPVLKDVYYIQSQVNRETQQVTNTLIKRGQEWHAPDSMILNVAHVLYIEPVKPDSTMAKLIEESAKQK